MFEGFERRRIDTGEATINCVTGGAKGTMAKNFDIPAEWRKRCTNVQVESLPGGHFFIGQFPEDTARVIARLLAGAAP